jgi:FtsP/CotA-like multicopper oxidase with cupredoxin domain
MLAPAQALADGGVCPRPAVGSIVAPPPDLFSDNGVLNVSLNYFTSMDDVGRTLFCFVTPDGMESPTLHVKPGDVINIHVTNQIPGAPLGASETVSGSDTQCGSAAMTATSMNMHFHGLNVTPGCHGDETIHTIINSGESFDYKLRIPANEPPGLYWYHPHIHGSSSVNVQGGATGMIEVEGIENIQPAVAGLPERFLILRDQQLGYDGRQKSPFTPNWDVSINYVGVPYPDYPPAIIRMQKGTQEFWRIANASANTILNLQVQYDSLPQPLQITGFDGVPTGSQDGKRQGTIVTQNSVLLPPAARVEFIVAAPSRKVKDAKLITLGIHGGPAADTNPTRPYAVIQTTDEPAALPRTPERSGPPNVQRFENLADAKVTANRTLYFFEVPSILAKEAGPTTASGKGKVQLPPAEPVKFYITVEGQFNQLFDPNAPPAITTNRGAVEEWTIQNRTAEVHEFHIHQVHFLVEEMDGVPVPKDKQQFYDTHQVDFWDGIGPYPYIKVKLDFRGAVTGDFVYHCHILDHEDGGMMAIIRVLPKGEGATNGSQHS